MYKNLFIIFTFFLVSISVSVFAQTDPGTENLTHSWTFDDGTPTDLIGGANGVLMGEAYIADGSLFTDRGNAWLEMPGDQIAMNAYNEVTVEAWVVPAESLNTGFTMLTYFGNSVSGFGSNGYFISIARGDDKSRAAISTGDESTPWESETGADGIEIDDGKLHHVVSTINGSDIALYIDGQLQSSNPLADNSISLLGESLALLAKGGYTDDPTWMGEILEVNVYNKALSSDEISFLYNNSDAVEGKKPIIVEAESGQLGTDFSTGEDGDISYIATTLTYTGTASPGSEDRIATYQVTFKDSGFYSLYVRLNVGAGSFDDDSFFYARGFGEKNDTASTDWVFVNGLASAGFAESTEVVNEVGAAGTEVWKWVNVSKNTYSGAIGDSFYVSLDSLTQAFQIASREDGLSIDKIAFGKSSLFYTVANLDNGEPGTAQIEGPPEAYDGPPLASKQPKFVGNIYSSPQINNFESYWNQVIAENAGKWGSVEGTRDDMNWSGLDASYNLAKDNGFPYTFHVLLWGAQQPSWIDSLEASEQLEEIREWYQAVADRYPDIDYLQVVNEPLFGHNPPDGTNGRANYKEALGGNGSTGWDWVLNAFRMAKEIFPNTKLMINDFNIINSSTNTNIFVKIVNLLKEEGLIDVIGVQGHASSTTATNTTLRSNLTKLGSTGLPVHVTELDIDGLADETQLYEYQRIFPELYEHSAVEGITLWGWRPGLWRSDEGAYIITQNGEERPALVWLRDYLDSVDVTVGVEDVSELPNQFALENNYPNPFNPTTVIGYNVPVTSKVTLSVYNVLGQKVATLFNGTKNAGHYEVTFDAKGLTSGIYFYTLTANDFVATKKLMLLK